jgi:hypothetical protein
VSNVCVIHDRHKGILQAISDIKEGSQERYRAAQWPDVHSRWCMRHMGANFHSHCWGIQENPSPSNVRFDKVLETCFSGTGNSRFSEAWNLRSLGFANM